MREAKKCLHKVVKTFSLGGEALLRLSGGLAAAQEMLGGLRVSIL